MTELLIFAALVFFGALWITIAIINAESRRVSDVIVFNQQQILKEIHALKMESKQ